MTTPRTEAGRALLDDMIAVPDEPLDVMGVVRLEYRETFGTRLRAIEDEAARMERERIAAAVEALQPASGGWSPSATYVLGTVLAAITDTGEETAP